MSTETLFGAADAYTTLAEVAADGATPDIVEPAGSPVIITVFTVGVSVGTILVTSEHEC
ncbi:hypothetical protein [Virgisporangium aurantiacum]|uniref:Uncharacterized protein n=1 Tax=Virgisporangium aurantiacum TaxID=175570 RepID=A0A8J3Z8U6_9ACTN|nr:hypothetical protein [Virgisporangium aurantiacum]GIJ58488.1 hypothetical protein Vau01_060040 [Virgisporangium aurantiacum]